MRPSLLRVPDDRVQTGARRCYFFSGNDKIMRTRLLRSYYPVILLSRNPAGKECATPGEARSCVLNIPDGVGLEKRQNRGDRWRPVGR